jgi:hypothetical protein
MMAGKRKAVTWVLRHHQNPWGEVVAKVTPPERATWARMWREVKAIFPLPPSKRHRKPGGGRREALTAADVTELQKFYLRMLEEGCSQKIAAEAMRRVLGRVVSDMTLQRWVMRPVLAQFAGQNKPRRSK